MAQKLDVSFLYMYVCFNKPFLNLNFWIEYANIGYTYHDCEYNIIDPGTGKQYEDDALRSNLHQ